MTVRKQVPVLVRSNSLNGRWQSKTPLDGEGRDGEIDRRQKGGPMAASNAGEAAERESERDGCAGFQASPKT